MKPLCVCLELKTRLCRLRLLLLLFFALILPMDGAKSRMLRGIFERETFSPIRFRMGSQNTITRTRKRKDNSNLNLLSLVDRLKTHDEKFLSFFRLRPYHGKKLGSRPIPAVKPCRARVVLRQETLGNISCCRLLFDSIFVLMASVRFFCLGIEFARALTKLVRIRALGRHIPSNRAKFASSSPGC